MSARIIPFPLARRVDWLERNSRRIASYIALPRQFEAILDRTIQMQIDDLTKIGVQPTYLAREVRAAERAIRTRVDKLTTYMKAN